MRLRPKKLLLLAVGCSYPILWVVLTLIFTVVLSPAIDPPWEWDAASNKPVPDSFAYLMFPKNQSVAAFDKPDGVSVVTLDRAMVNGHHELDDAWIGLAREPVEDSLWVRRTDLVFDVASPLRESLVSAASADYTFRTHNQFASIALGTLKTSSQKEYELEIRPDDNHVEDYVYSVTNGIATPLRMRRYFGPGEALKSIGNVPLSALLATLILALPIVVWRVRHRRAAAVIHATTATHDP